MTELPVWRLRPDMIFPMRDTIVVLDQVQPVAVAFRGDGSYHSSASWSELVAAPHELMSPTARRIARIGDELLVLEYPDAPVVALGISAGGTLAAVTGERLPPNASLEKSPLWRVPNWRSSKDGWYAETELRDGYLWSATLTRGRGGAVGRVEFGEPASIHSLEVAEGTAFVTVQRANKRPWQFTPVRELYRVANLDGTLVAQLVELPLVESRLWGSASSDEQEGARLVDYLTFSLGGARGIRELGARDVEITIKGAGPATTIQTRFRLPRLPGRSLIQTDRPFDEVGRTVGLRYWNVLLDEDMATGGLDRVVSHAPDGADEVQV